MLKHWGNICIHLPVILSLLMGFFSCCPPFCTKQYAERQAMSRHQKQCVAFHRYQHETQQRIKEIQRSKVGNLKNRKSRVSMLRDRICPSRAPSTSLIVPLSAAGSLIPPLDTVSVSLSICSE